MAGLVAGSMVPDLPLFGMTLWTYRLSHSPLGLVSVDVAAGIVAAALWTLLIRNVLYEAAPSWLRARTNVGPTTRRDWALLPVAALLGATTHVLWDEMTHEGRWGQRHVAWLAHSYWGYAGYQWAQALSSLLGLAVEAVYLAFAVRRGPRRLVHVRAPLIARCGVVAAVVVSATVGIAYFFSADNAGLHAAAFSAVTHALPAAVLAGTLASVVWYLVARSAADPGPARTAA